MSINQDNINKFISQIEEQLSNFSDNNPVITSIITNIIKNNLTNDIYNIIPEDILKIVENNDILGSLELARNFLISSGIPEDIVSELSITDIQYILKSISLFIRSPSSISQISNLFQIFKEDIYVAELYLTIKNNKVYLVPYWLTDDVPDSIKEEYKQIDYETAYNSIPELLLPEKYYISEYQNNNIVLPLKTNILLIVARNTNDQSLINHIISYIIFKEHQDKTITLYHDSTFKIEFKDVIKYYYYLYALFYDMDVLSIPDPESVTIQYSYKNTTFTDSDIKQLLDAENIRTRAEYIELINNIKSHFTPTTVIQKQVTKDTLQSYLYSKYPDLILYINSLYNNSDNKKYTLYRLIYDVRKSVQFNLYYYSEYIDIFIDTFLTLPVIDITQNTSYKLLTYYKPINVSLLTIALDHILLRISGPTENLFLDTFYQLLIEINKVSWETIRDKLVNIVTSMPKHRYPIFDTKLLDIVKRIFNSYNIDDKLFNLVDIDQVSWESIKDKSYTENDVIKKYRQIIFDTRLSNTIKQILENYSIDDSKQSIVNTNQTSWENIKDKLVNIVTSISEHRYPIFDARLLNVIKQLFDNYNIDDIIKQIIVNTNKVSWENIKDNLYTETNITKKHRQIIFDVIQLLILVLSQDILSWKDKIKTYLQSNQTSIETIRDILSILLFINKTYRYIINDIREFKIISTIENSLFITDVDPSYTQQTNQISFKSITDRYVSKIQLHKKSNNIQLSGRYNTITTSTFHEKRINIRYRDYYNIIKTYKDNCQINDNFTVIIV